jgi:predicted RNA-binding Zn ribbon-like protein
MPAQSKDAPGELNLVRSFVNTLDLDDGVETLATPASLAAWLADQGLMDYAAAAGQADVRRTVALREAFRELLLSNNDGHPVDESATAVVDEAAARAKLRLRVTSDGGARLEAQAQGVDGALGRLLIIAYRAMETGTWRRLKACRNDTCRWAFYDHSRNSSGHWCSMEACGSREKARAYRQRKHAAGGGEAHQ